MNERGLGTTFGIRNSRPHRMRRAAKYGIFRVPVALLTVSVLGSCELMGQSVSAKTLDELNRAGFGFYDLSVFSGYSTTTGPSFDPLTSTLLPDASFHTLSAGISTSVGWRSRKSETLNFHVRYSPSVYYQTSSRGYLRSRFTPQHTLDLGWNRNLGTKWTAGFSLSGSLGNFDQFLLLPTTAQGLSLLPGTAAGLFGSALGASALVTPQQSLYYGGRILSSAAQTSLSYAITPRLSISLGVGANRMQHIRDQQNLNPSPVLLQQTTSMSGSLSLDYAISPRTNFFTSVSYYRAISSLATTPSASVMFGVSRTITERLVVHAAAGAGYILPHGTQGPALQRTQWQASGGLSYRAFRQTFFGSVNRSASDVFGLGVAATVDASGGWSWGPPRGSWGISAGAHDTWLQGYSLGTNGYNANVGVYRTIRRRASVSLNYGYGSYSSGSLGLLPSNVPLHYASHSIRLSIGFSPYLGVPDGARGID